MTTLPPERPAQPARESHHYRAVAESFGVDPDRYDRTRPSYPGALVERIVAESPGSEVLDVGSGTGIVARQLQAAGCRVLGVEPDSRMAGFARQTGVHVAVSTFEAWDPAGREFDAVVAGQAWHWIDPVTGAAKAARVLRPAGLLALFWHTYQLPTALAEAAAAVFRRVLPDSPFPLHASPTSALNGYQPLVEKAVDGIASAGGFADPQQWRFDWQRSYTTAQWLDQLPATGALTQLPPDVLGSVLDGVGAAIDAAGGNFTLPYVTVAVAARRTGAGLLDS
jgi:SAM-dependent methyltransferase